VTIHLAMQYSDDTYERRNPW